MSTSVELNQRSGAELGTQVWIGRSAGTLKPARLKTIRRNEFPWSKPRNGGLWTAQWDQTYGGGWVQWCYSEGFEVPDDLTWPHVSLLEPDPAARVLVIDTYTDLERVYDLWPQTMPNVGIGTGEGYPAWEQVAEHYDAVHVTEEGQWRTRLSQPLNLYGWDCESTLWLRWAFTETRYLGAQEFQKLEDPWS